MKNIKNPPVDKDGKYVLIFTSNHCPYCRKMEKILKQIEKKYAQKDIEFFNINISNNMELAEKYNIKSTPQTFFMHGNKVVGSEMGAVSTKAVEMQLEDLLKSGELLKKIKGLFSKRSNKA